MALLEFTKVALPDLETNMMQIGKIPDFLFHYLTDKGCCTIQLFFLQCLKFIASSLLRNRAACRGRKTQNRVFLARNHLF